MYIYIESFGWLSILVAAAAGAAIGFLLPRYIPPRRTIDLIKQGQIKGGTTDDGIMWSRIEFIVRYEGPEIVPLPIAEWIPKNRVHRETLFEHKGQQALQPSGKVGSTLQQDNWSVHTLKPRKWREDLRLYPGETVKLRVTLRFQEALWKSWHEQEIDGRIRLQYSKGRFLEFTHRVSF